MSGPGVQAPAGVSNGYATSLLAARASPAVYGGASATAEISSAYTEDLFAEMVHRGAPALPPSMAFRCAVSGALGGGGPDAVTSL